MPFLCRPPQSQHHFSIETLTGVLRKAAQKRKYIREEKTQDKLDVRSKEEASRSNSQASDAPSKLAMIPAQSSTGIHCCNFCKFLDMHKIVVITLKKDILLQRYAAKRCRQ